MDVRRSLPLTLGVLGFCSLLSISAQGPDTKGAVLRSPFDTPAPAAPSAAPGAMPSYMKDIMPDAGSGRPGDPNVRRSINPDDDLVLNRNLQVTPAAGNWLVMVISYPGKDGPVYARKMCLELKNTKRVPAYVFVYGAEERRKEYERVKKVFDQQQAFFKEKDFKPSEPLRMRQQHIDVQHAVLIGGYPTVEAANAALLSMRKWESPDPKKVELETQYYVVNDPNNPNKPKQADSAYVNPFKRAIVCKNPTIKQDVKEEPKLDVAALRRMNSDEKFSLFNCKKPYTLAVKEFQTPFTMQTRDASPTLMESLGASKAARDDFASKSAHNLADSLRKVKLEAFVLHAKFSSTVTVGSFDSPNDPALLAMQETLATRFNQPPFTQIQFFARPVPMAVPR